MKNRLRGWAAGLMLLTAVSGYSNDANAETGEGLAGTVFFGRSPSGLQAGDTFAIEIKGSGLVDLYAYEAAIGFDPDKLVPGEAQSGLPGGYDITKEEPGVIRMASTRIGSGEGISGERVIGRLTFKVRQSGMTRLTLDRVVLLDSRLERKTIEHAGEAELSAAGEQEQNGQKAWIDPRDSE
ncbi:hypothetical protein SAMN02799630_04739 [Paenibacillus sp. UNCCL117]|uniref:cohesin domain-containing protein n=1 Tax=unclassified Paenibacillus TaxID=185978 RepID=UPI00088F11DB|nr:MULTISPECIES: cohesin domain-containing protein [unclassified Paenibacillus]SDE11453.1 hypothetical protein SAMN04488602_11945 [Paenibacillus sp. cl123]SFW59988.1 hypothetical protein SAMN02799630_04739 [Paenibacillus sp. UNCCL117]